jgi:hypothetical protein
MTSGSFAAVTKIAPGNVAFIFDRILLQIPVIYRYGACNCKMFKYSGIWL